MFIVFTISFLILWFILSVTETGINERSSLIRSLNTHTHTYIWDLYVTYYTIWCFSHHGVYFGITLQFSSCKSRFSIPLATSSFCDTWSSPSYRHATNCLLLLMLLLVFLLLLLLLLSSSSFLRSSNRCRHLFPFHKPYIHCEFQLLLFTNILTWTKNLLIVFWALLHHISTYIWYCLSLIHI